MGKKYVILNCSLNTRSSSSLVCALLDVAQNMNISCFFQALFMWLPSYVECPLISNTKIVIRGGGECFVKLNHRFNPAEKYGVEQYWFRGCKGHLKYWLIQSAMEATKSLEIGKMLIESLLHLAQLLPPASMCNQFIRFLSEVFVHTCTWFCFVTKSFGLFYFIQTKDL